LKLAVANQMFAFPKPNCKSQRKEFFISTQTNGDKLHETFNTYFDIFT